MMEIWTADKKKRQTKSTVSKTMWTEPSGVKGDGSVSKGFAMQS